MRPLLERLITWNAYNELRNTMRDYGFALNEKCLQVLADRCKINKEFLERYWREESLEYVTSAGKNDSSLRSFPVNEGYRSAYLDALAASLPDLDQKERGLPLLPPLRELQRQLYASHAASASINELLDDAKFAEYADRTVNIPSDFDTKKGQFAAFSILAESVGFARKKNTLLKKSGSLYMKITADLGGLREPIGIQFSTQVFDDRDPDFVFWVHAHNILPGMGHYTVYKSPEEGMHCLNACCVFRNEFFESLRGLKANESR